MSTSGGRSQPVSHGENARATHPDGVIRNAIPNAEAACGTESNGDSKRRIRLNARVPCHPAMIKTVINSDRDVAKNPVVTLSITACGKPPQRNKSTNGATVLSVILAAGKYPNAGAMVPSNPATTGPSMASTVSNGSHLMLIPRRIFRTCCPRSLV